MTLEFMFNLTCTGWLVVLLMLWVNSLVWGIDNEPKWYSVAGAAMTIATILTTIVTAFWWIWS